MGTGFLLTVRLGLLQVRHLGKAFRFMVKNEEEGHGEVTSFGALCTALSATIGTGNIAGVATALAAGGPGALFWMIVAAFLGMATKYAEGLLAIKYRTVDKDGHILGGPFYYIENGMGKNWRWLAKIFAFFGACVGLFGIGTFTQVNSIASAVTNFFDPETANAVSLFGRTYSWSTVITCIILTLCVGLVVIGGIKRIAKVSEIVVPFMAILYVALGLIIIFTNLPAVPGAVVSIVKSAFTGSALAGGAMGSMVVAMQQGIARGIFSTGAAGPRFHDRYIHRYDRDLYDDRYLSCDRRLLDEPGPGRRGDHNGCVPERASLPERSGNFLPDDLSCVFRIYDDPRMELLW